MGINGDHFARFEYLEVFIVSYIFIGRVTLRVRVAMKEEKETSARG